MTDLLIRPERRAEVESFPPGPGSVRIKGLRRVFGQGSSAVVALEQVDLSIRPGEFVSIVGASGGGKSTLLNLVAGLDSPTAGSVEVDGRTSVMFQEPALFPWLTVSKNIELALRLDGVGRSERRQRAQELLSLVRLETFADNRPHELSGGMRQRVALARALARRADVCLMDEPFGALDAMTRDLLHEELEQLVVGRTTVLFITHNVREAVRLGDRVVLMSSRPGRVAAEYDIAIDRPRRIEDQAVSELAAEITARLRAEVAGHGRA